MTASEIEQQIAKHLPDAKISVSGDEGKYEATVISTRFEDMSQVLRHQTVYAGVNQSIANGDIHALSIRAYTPAEHATNK